MTDTAPDAPMISGNSDPRGRLFASSAWDVPVIAASVKVPLVAHCGEASAQNPIPNEEHARND